MNGGVQVISLNSVSRSRQTQVSLSTDCRLYVDFVMGFKEMTCRLVLKNEYFEIRKGAKFQYSLTYQGPLNIWTEHSNCQIHSRGDTKTLLA